MLSEGFVDYLTETFGADKNYKVKSTNHAACTNSPCPNSPMSGRSQFVRFERTHKGADQTMRRTSQIGAEIHERWEG